MEYTQESRASACGARPLCRAVYGAVWSAAHAGPRVRRGQVVSQYFGKLFGQYLGGGGGAALQRRARATWRGAADATLEGGAVAAAVCAILLDRDFGPRPIIVRLAAVEERGLRSGGERSGGEGVGQGVN